MRGPSRLYVGRLGHDIRRRDLEKFFRGYGRINEILLKEGFAFVEIDDDKDARDAVRDLNGRSVIPGTRVNVEFSRGPRTSSSRRYDDDRRRDDGRGRATKYGPPRNTDYGVRVENLSSRVSWQDLKDFMRSADVEVTYADAHRKERGVGFVDFATAADMRQAIQKLDGQDLHGRRVRIEEKRRRTRSRSRSRSPRRRSASRSRSRSNEKDSEVSRSPKSERSEKSPSPARSESRSRSASPEENVQEDDAHQQSGSENEENHENGDGSESEN